VVWEANSHQNGLLLTEACDCHCLMCPQPPTKNDPELLALAHQILDRLEPNEVGSICLTGGEPSLLKDDFVSLLEKVHRKFPKKHVILLTNGKNFSDFSFAKRCAIAAGGQVEFCISLHADNDLDHDRIVGVPGSFQKTIKGITNLARLGVPIEIRFVINKINVDRMTEFAVFCYRNFPFVVHVAFMAMEVRGLADDNIQEVWIDPMMYGEKVRFAANRLAMRGMRVSIYNMPLCLLPQEGWPFAKQSISVWKNDFLGVCQECDVRSQCAGIFTSSSRQSEFLAPIKGNLDIPA
jgi:His-Xaa-Ser system radical SAM maturase HxsC